MWAHRSLGEKNKMTATDALQVENAFQATLASLATGDTELRQTPAGRPQTGRHARKPKKRAQSKTIDKSMLTFPEPRRVRDRNHVKGVAQHPCLICGRRPADAHHLRFAQSRALGRKVSDEYTVPLCRGHHREVHHCGDEAAWWRNAGVDPTVAARSLWLETHPVPGTTDETPPRIKDVGSTDSVPAKAGLKAARRFKPTDPVHKTTSDGVG
jgi:hypothetical protein